MRYWAYINNQVCGPFEKEKLPGIANFGPASLVCPENTAGGDASAWKEAGTFPEVLAALNPAAAPAPAPAPAPEPLPEQPRTPAAESPLLMTMRGTLIEPPVIDEPASPPPAAAPVKIAAESPLAMTMRGTLINEPPVEAAPAASAKAPGSVEIETFEKVPGSAFPDAAPAAAATPGRREQAPQTDPQAQKLDQMSAMMAAIANNQSQLLNRLDHIERAVAEMKALLFPPPPGKR